MKKITALFLATVLVAVLFTGCGTTTGDTVKTGLAVITSVLKSKDAGETSGLAQADSTIIAVTVDGKGKITDCVIDAVQTKVDFTASGEITTALDSVIMTKNELGTEYGMKGSSSIGKEWSEQAASFAQYVVGKTVSEVKGISVTEDGYAAAADLKASVTIHVTDFITGVEKAAANAADLGAKTGEKLRLATVTNIESSKNATAQETGLAQIYSTYVALTQDSSGKITSCVFDSSQSNINFDAAGKITTDLTVAPKTKNELKEAYGMGAKSSIGKEWYQQAASFAAYVKGKTVAEVKGIAVSESGQATDADLSASVTIHVTDFINLIDKAAD
ncbi:MAG: hypothetical protein VB111_01700 [Clostridiaceae bacterium]|nr:hypothetical protein [Clostridiaceae bacterium]